MKCEKCQKEIYYKSKWGYVRKRCNKCKNSRERTGKVKDKIRTCG